MVRGLGLGEPGDWQVRTWGGWGTRRRVGGCFKGVGQQRGLLSMWLGPGKQLGGVWAHRVGGAWDGEAREQGGGKVTGTLGQDTLLSSWETWQHLEEMCGLGHLRSAGGTLGDQAESDPG